MNAFTQFLLAIIRARKIVFAGALVWAIAGIWIALNTPIDALPDLSENQVLVYAPWPDHNPPEIFESVTRPLSAALQNIPGVVTLRGSSDVGFSLLVFIFDNSIDFSDARRRVATRLQALDVDLPAGVEPQLAADGIPTGQIVWYTLTGRDTDLVELRSWQEDFIAPQLRTIRGVAEVASVGGFEPELHIDFNAEALIASQLTLDDVEQQLRKAPLAQTQETLRTTASLTAHVHQLENFTLDAATGDTLRLRDVSRVTLQPAPRYGVFEKDGNETVAGVVHLQVGANPLQVTDSVLTALQRIGDQLPAGYRLTPCYDRTDLIGGAVKTVTRTLLEALIVTTVCIVLIMRHIRSSLVIALTLPLAVLGALSAMRLLAAVGHPVHVNIMSLAGIAISIGVLVDAAVVIVENVTYQLKREFGNDPVSGNTDFQVARATAMVARPAVLAILIMLVSFLPMFALDGIDGQLIRPLAWTKTLTLLSVIILTLTLVPALCRQFIRGSIRSEQDSTLLRSICRVYEPVLRTACARPWPLVLLLACLLILAATALGNSLAIRAAVLLGIAGVWLAVQSWSARIGLAVCMLSLALVARSTMLPIALALRLPLDEGMVMDMPISLPRMTTTQAIDDLKARNMLLCRFPEVAMVTGKAGRAETAFDPAPIDMIESMVEFRPREHWPRRCLPRETATRLARYLVQQMVAAELVEPAADQAQLTSEIVDAALLRFNAVQRELCWHMLQTFEKSLGDELAYTVTSAVVRHSGHTIGPSQKLDDVQIRTWANSIDRRDRRLLAQQSDANAVHIVVRELQDALSKRESPAQLLARNKIVSTVADERDAGGDSLKPLMSVAPAEDQAELEASILREVHRVAHRRWKHFVRAENQLLSQRAAATWTQCVIEELCSRQAIIDSGFKRTREQIVAARYALPDAARSHGAVAHAGLPSVSELPIIDPHPVFDALMRNGAEKFEREAWLWPHDAASLTGPRGELDVALQMPGWANVWTRPIQNRIDMLSTGVNSEVGIRVLGNDFQKVVNASQQIAEVVRQIPGAADVIADPIRDKDYVTFQLDTDRVRNAALEPAAVEVAIEAATRGRLLEFHATVSSPVMPVRIKLSSNLSSRSNDAAAQSNASYLDIPLPIKVAHTDETSAEKALQSQQLFTLGELATPLHHDGPATVKSTNGQLSNYVRLNIRDRNASEWVEEAKAAVEHVALPSGVFIEWTGQFEHAARTRQSMWWIIPVCALSIGLLLLLAFHDVADMLLILTSVVGAFAGAVLAQWLCSFPFSLAVGVGYIACLGMAAATGMVMIVYLRQSLEDGGGLSQIASLDELRSRVVAGAVHRLRPKLLTETTMILSLAPLLWSDGVGADVIRPMAAPVLGGILVADEVIDLLVPAMFFAIRRRRWQRSVTAVAQDLTHDSNTNTTVSAVAVRPADNCSRLPSKIGRALFARK